MDTCTAPAGTTTKSAGSRLERRERGGPQGEAQERRVLTPPGGRPVAVPSRIADSYRNLNSDKP
jgi:hypothetical protein